MKLLATRKRDQNRAAVDPWTVVHFSTGLALGLMDVPLRTSVAAAVAYEIAEQFLERRRIGQELLETSGPESIPNATVDVAVFLVGHLMGDRWNRTG